MVIVYCLLIGRLWLPSRGLSSAATVFPVLFHSWFLAFLLPTPTMPMWYSCAYVSPVRWWSMVTRNCFIVLHRDFVTAWCVMFATISVIDRPTLTNAWCYCSWHDDATRKLVKFPKWQKIVISPKILTVTITLTVTKNVNSNRNKKMLTQL